MSTLVVVHDLGDLYANQGKLVEATQMYRRVLSEREELYGPNHTLTLATLITLGRLHYEQGELSEAERIYRRIISAAVDGEFHWRKGVHGFVLVLTENLRLQADNPMVVRNLLAELVQRMDDWITSNGLVIRHLAKAFIFAKEDEDASMAFFHALKGSDYSADGIDIFCDGCDKMITVEKGRWICRQCVDTDLCNSCMARCVAGDLSIATCYGHEYCDAVELLKRAFGMPQSPSKKDWTLWLAELRKKYQVQGV